MVLLKKIVSVIKVFSESTLSKALAQPLLTLIFVCCLNLSLISRGALFATIFLVGLVTKSFIRSLSFVFASIAFATAGVSLVVLVRPGLIISDYTITVLVLCTTFTFTILELKHFPATPKRVEDNNTSATDYLLVLPFALICLLTRRWVATNNPIAIFNLFGSEDNSAWLSTAKGFASGAISADGFTHPTAQSPAVGPIIAFISAFTRIGNKSVEARPHLLALETVRNTFAFLIISASITAGAISRNVRLRIRHRLKTADTFIVFFCAIAEFMLFNILFFQHGFLSFMGAAVFALLALEFCTSSQNNDAAIYHFATIGLLLIGIGSSWWGTTPVSAVLLFILVCGLIKRYKTDPRTIRSSVIFCTITGGLVLNQMRDLIFHGSSTLTNAVRATGTVEELSPLGIVVVIGIIFAGISRSVFNSDSKAGSEYLNANLLLATAAIFAMAIWIMSFLQTGMPNYAAYKIIYFLILLAVPVAFSFSTFGKQSSWKITSISQPIFIFFLIGTISTTFLYIKLPSPAPVTSWKSQIIKALDSSPNSIVMCVHSDEQNRIQAYVCSRFAQALSRSESSLTYNWMQAIVYPTNPGLDGVDIPREETSGGLALKAFNESIVESKRPISVVVFPDFNFDPVTFEWDPDFWWLREIQWNHVHLVR